MSRFGICDHCGLSVLDRVMFFGERCDECGEGHFVRAGALYANPVMWAAMQERGIKRGLLIELLVT